MPESPDPRTGMTANALTRVKNVPIVLILWLVLYLAYVEVVAPNYWYLDMGLVDFDVAALLLNVATLLVASLALPSEIRQPSTFVIWMMYVLVAVSTSFVPLVSGRLDAQESWVVTALACGVIVVMSILNASAPGGVRKPDLRPRSYLHLVFVIAVAANVSVFVFTGFSLEMPAIDEIYDARLEFRTIIDSLPFFVGYAIPLAANVLNPLVLVVSVHLRSYWIAGIAVMFQAGLYSIDGQKMVLLLPAAVLGVYFFARSRRTLHSGLTVAIVTVMVLVVTLLVPFMGRVPFEVSVRRLAMIPGQLVGAYFDYFGTYGFAYLQHSRFFNSGNLTPEPGYLIGQYVFGSTVQNANASIIGDGFANFGVLGVALNAIICGILLRMMDAFTVNIPLSMRLAIAVSPVIILSNNAMLTALLTSGLFVLMILLYLMPSMPFSHRRDSASPSNAARERIEVRS